MAVATGIGETLREARNRRKLDLSEVEAAIKIRVRYLQALENEEWDALPGGAYTRGFIRTYAAHLGLDGDRLADDYRRDVEPLGERVPKRVEPVPTGARNGGSRISGRLLIAIVCLVLVAAVVGIALAGGGGEGGSSSPKPSAQAKSKQKQQHKQASAAKPGVAVRLAARGEVWVCLLDATEKPLVDGQILGEGEEAGPYRSSGFEMAFGNGSVDVYVDGRPEQIEESSSPVGYAVDGKGNLVALEEGERPSCE
ncbi:MAG TPA: helix-turn-helix domain-containing protein [Solirubrobacterales bacterium]|nr:helix-turn-helix domain-containing protein [Solirubrobacterales bacterium]